MNLTSVKRMLDDLTIDQQWNDTRAAAEIGIDRRTISAIKKGEAKRVRAATVDAIQRVHERLVPPDVNIPRDLWKAGTEKGIPADIIDFAMKARLRPLPRRDQSYWADLLTVVNLYRDLFEVEDEPAT